MIDQATSIILDSIADGVFTVDREWKITSFNRAAEQITGIPKKEAIGKPCCDVFRASICETECALRNTMETGKPIINKAIYIINNKGQKVPISISTALLKDAKNQTLGGVETFRDLSLVEDLRKELTSKYTFEDIISKNHRMQKLFDILPEISRSSSTILIEGESGTGKELFAKAIHNLSPRADKPIVSVNCGALPDNLLESELFGYKAGAFTDARKDKPGRFALAEGGTIFLDEIADISPAFQVRLLRILQEKTYEPLGGQETIKANVRVIVATNRNLEEMVKKGTFRTDLYYRINILRLSLPPLRERKEDLPLLIEHLITKFRILFNKDISGVSPDVMSILLKHNYPGNIRELENIIEHSFLLCPSGIIKPEHLPEQLTEAIPQATFQPSTLSDLESAFIIDTLRRNNWNRSASAKELGIHKSTLFRKIKKLGLSLPEQDGRSKK